MRKEKRFCDDCRAPLEDEDVFVHGGKNYCPQCMAIHIKNEHIKKERLTTPEEKRAWTYKSY